MDADDYVYLELLCHSLELDQDFDEDVCYDAFDYIIADFVLSVDPSFQMKA